MKDQCNWQTVRTAKAIGRPGTTFAALAEQLCEKAWSRMSALPLSSLRTKNSAGTVAGPEDRANAVEANPSLTALLHHGIMRVWKLQTSDSEVWLPSSWGYALAAAAEETVQLRAGHSSKRLICVHEERPAMLRPDAPSARVAWTSP